jgi:hypothetical protein
LLTLLVDILLFIWSSLLVQRYVKHHSRKRELIELVFDCCAAK